MLAASLTLAIRSRRPAAGLRERNPVADPKETDLAKHWVHSHEEDREGVEVYRTPDYPFPPARGRDALTLQPGGTLVREIPGPDDRRTTMPAGSWTLHGKALTLHHRSGPSTEYTVESVEPDKLTLRPS
jgi:hypothetical protein